MLDDWAISTSWKKKIAGLIYEKEHLAKATCLRALCVSEAVSMRRYSLKNPICKIPNGIDLPSLPVSCPAPWRDEIEAGKKILLFLGRIHEKKGLKNLVIAWAQLLKENCKFISDWELVIAGWDTTGHQQELGKLVDDLQVRNCVRFIGPQFNNQKIAAYHNADAFVLPSFSEGLPMTVLEAWAYGLPVIMTPQCNIPEGFHENAALKVELDYRSIKMGLLDLFSLSDAERKDIGSHGLSLVKHKFTWGKVAEQINQVNQWILGGGGPPECVQFSE
jgi:poly(glycerol-phosphate) alpha-glucosyltransferase